MTVQIQNNISLDSYTSWLVGGPAEYFCLPQNKAELEEAIHWAADNKQPLTILGGGSNVLVSDKGVRGLVICMKKFSHFQLDSITENEVRFRALSGTGKSELLKFFLKNKRAPALFLAGLPGDVGGGVVMNAGVSENMVPREFGEIVEWVEVLKYDENSKKISYQKYFHKDIDWQYRHSFNWQPGIVTEVAFRYLCPVDPQILEKVKSANLVRLSKQPLDKPSCGSVFINPVGHKSAQLIDQCGLKGFQIGDAQVSLKHANFIVNLDQAKAEDIWKLIQHVKKTVFEKTQVELKTEVIRLGEWS